MDWMLVLSLLFIQSQFFLFHVDYIQHSTEACDMFMCRESHTLGALGAILIVWFLDYSGSIYREKFLNTKGFDTIIFLKYVVGHVFLLPLSGLLVVYLVPWLKEEWFYTFNVWFLVLLFSTRALSARRNFIFKTQDPSKYHQRGSHVPNGSQVSTLSSTHANGANSYQDIKTTPALFGTPQPKYFFRTPGRRNKHD
tara:strand:+ start:172 stop:759 length:588 start_codon:yes stop_codon:yes gene_type:complete